MEEMERWTESIAQKVKRKKKVEINSRKEIWHSVFAPQVEPVATDSDTLVRTYQYSVDRFVFLTSYTDKDT